MSALTVEALMDALGTANLFAGSSMTGAAGTVDERLAQVVAQLNAAITAHVAAAVAVGGDATQCHADQGV